VNLEGRGLTIGYADLVVGTGLDVTLASGEVLALLGPNGGGKTTLLKTLIGLLPPLAGVVHLDGTSLAALSLRERARLLAYVPQVHVATFAFPVATVVLMGRTARISGGERQLVLLARALAQEPRFVVLDEPTASLDFGNQGRVLGEIRALAQMGHGVLFTTHDPNHALRVADRVYLLREGSCLAAGPTADVLTRERLQDLYRAPIAQLIDSATGAVAFSPG
jgi:iron complex transport system ATP-binding protein